MHRRILLLLLPALLAGLAAPAAAPAAAKRRVPQGFLGVNLNGPMLDAGVDLAGESATMVRAGAEAVRLPVFWAAEQPYATAADVPPDRRAAFVDAGGVPTDFSASDRLIGAAAAHGLRILVTVARTPPWAAKQPTLFDASPPRDPGTYAAFMTAPLRPQPPPAHRAVVDIGEGEDEAPLRLRGDRARPGPAHRRGSAPARRAAPAIAPGRRLLVHLAHASARLPPAVRLRGPAPPVRRRGRQQTGA